MKENVTFSEPLMLWFNSVDEKIQGSLSLFSNPVYSGMLIIKYLNNLY